MLFFLCAFLFQSVCVRAGDDVFLVATSNLFVILTRYRMPLLGAFSCRPSVSAEPSAARMPLLILWLSPTGYCCRERQNSLFVLEYTSSRAWFLYQYAQQVGQFATYCYSCVYLYFLCDSYNTRYFLFFHAYSYGTYILVVRCMKQSKDAVWSLVLLLVTGVRADPMYSYSYI